jgi:hypothetical protein
MRRHIFRALYAAVAAGIALTTFGLAGAGAQATVAGPSLNRPVYSNTTAGYHTWGRWFRYAATTVTVPSLPEVLPRTNGGSFYLWLSDSEHAKQVHAAIWVMPESYGVFWQGPGQSRWDWNDFGFSPHVGDKLAISIYYDKWQGYLYFTCNDLTHGTRQTVRVKSGSLLFNSAELISSAAPDQWPRADIRLWRVADTHLTTYTGVHGTATGPWKTGQMILTTDGTAKGEVMMSPSGLWNGDQNFGIWLRHR